MFNSLVDTESHQPRWHDLGHLSRQFQRVAFGTAAGVIERLTRLRDELGLDGIVAELNPGGRIPPELETRSLQILTRDVLPALR
jgi:hypothetical protein